MVGIGGRDKRSLWRQGVSKIRRNGL